MFLVLFALSWIVPPLLQKFAVAVTLKTKSDLLALDSALEDYSLANGGRYPESLEELVTPDRNGHTFVKGTKIPLDPWGRAYLYDPPDSERGFPIIYTLGKDGRPGGEDDDADLDSISLRRKK